MKSIGGFYELELPNTSFDFHQRAIGLSTGRACQRLMLQHIDIRKCYVPFYTCDAVFHPFELESVPIEEYSIDEQFEPKSLPLLDDGEYFFYINFFGIKSATVTRLMDLYGDKLIVDNTHLFFHEGYPKNWSFTSARKYFGVPDGAFLYSPVPISERPQRFEHISIVHNFLRVMGHQAQAHAAYTEYKRSLTAEVNSISYLSEKLLSVVDIEQVQKRRLENFWYLHGLLKENNRITIDESMVEVPFAYPLLPSSKLDKMGFYERGFFVPALWSDPIRRERPGFTSDIEIAHKLLPLPIDHRYYVEDMERMAKYILEII